MQVPICRRESGTVRLVLDTDLPPVVEDGWEAGADRISVQSDDLGTPPHEVTEDSIFT